MASPAQAGSFALEADQSPVSMNRFVGFLVTAGLINSLIVAYLLCRLPASHSPSLLALFVRAFLYVLVACLAGMIGARFYWNRSSTPFLSDPPLSFNLFALANAAGWVWLPSVVLLSAQDSPASPTIAVIGAALLAAGLRKTIPAAASLHQHLYSAWEERELFADSLRTPPREAHAFVIAICIYIAAYALIENETIEASGLFALCAFLITWKLTLNPGPISGNKQRRARAALRLARIAAFAILVTMLALRLGVASRNQAIANATLAAANGSQTDGANQRTQHPAQPSASGISGYESIILWPIPEKKQVIAPIPAPTSLLAPGTTKPLVIRFDGPYWYFQPPGKLPGPRAHQANGTPLAFNIQADNFIPLTMEAHQYLSAPIRLSRLREIQLGILNRDNRPGIINLAVLLRDSASHVQPALYLGQQPVVTSQPGHFTIKTSPAAEVLRFPIPQPAKLHKFDEITVLFLPDGQNFEKGPKVALEQFQLIPR